MIQWTRVPHRLRRTALIAAAGLMASGALGAAQAEKLRLGNEGVYPPFSMVDSNGNLTGMEPELAREMCKRIGAECEIVVMDFKALIPSMLQGKFDGIVTQIAPTPERKDKALFAMPIVYNPATFIVKKDSSYTLTKEGVAGKGIKLALQRGSSLVPYIHDHFGKDTFTEVFYDNPDQEKLDLLAGRVDAVFDSKINWTLELISKPEGKDYMLAGGDHWLGDPAIPEDKRGYSWIFPKTSQALVDRVNTALEGMIKDCTFTTIRKKFVPVATLAAEAACENKVN
ncbi:transporter substrate-binding domain-containing protein [Ancylobacter sp. 6x-1]|uniref:Transporter substrate-binding domain-containing protein n=1 Tax=Ancylobacter crimeensis TaxID=2579147 RepID=A0ABT0DGL0_9HYPH|nr:transporter substrate-binding domain-containing protein [Ancylobacter crimeensis]MCK0198872.1 transporter substrate-binding domain-containing protein [Ancylobacter crimeensis]